MGCFYSKDVNVNIDNTSKNEDVKDVKDVKDKELKVEDNSFSISDIEEGENKSSIKNEIEEYIKKYKDKTNENTPYHSYENLKTYIKVLRVLDGDTLDIALYYEETEKVFKHRVRLFGIDTPEKRPLKSNINRDLEIEASKKSTEALTKKLNECNNILLALFYNPDKYGRLLCTLYDREGNDINEWMIKSGYAYEYFGKTKKKFESSI